MKKRSVNIIVGNAGGNAGETSKNYKVSIPTQWVNAMGLSVENRKIEISFDGERIIIEKPRTIKSFLEEKIKINHDVKIIELSENEVVHTKIVADFTDKTLCFENCSDNIIKTAFGVNENPSWADFESFLESRCIPRTSDGIKEYLNVLGLYEYDVVEIVKVTKGKMSEDNLVLNIEEI